MYTAATTSTTTTAERLGRLTTRRPDGVEVCYHCHAAATRLHPFFWEAHRRLAGTAYQRWNLCLDCLILWRDLIARHDDVAQSQALQRRGRLDSEWDLGWGALASEWPAWRAVHEVSP